jgi:hypothetical protein
MKKSIFWDAAPFSLVDIGRCFRGTYCLYYQGDETVNSSEALVNIRQTTRRNIPEDSHLNLRHLMRD